MRARLSRYDGFPIIDEDTSDGCLVSCTFTDRGAWYATNMRMLIVDAANSHAKATMGTRQFDPPQGRLEVGFLNGRPI